jgi:hypothetical protein
MRIEHQLRDDDPAFLDELSPAVGWGLVGSSDTHPTAFPSRPPSLVFVELPPPFKTMGPSGWDGAAEHAVFPA